MAGAFADPWAGAVQVSQTRRALRAEAVFRASLTELEGAGIRAVSAQALATGKSAELAREEINRAAAAGVTVLSMDDPLYPLGSKKSTIRRSSSMCAATRRS